MKVTIKFAWYDLWVGAFWSRDKRVLYVCPLPTILVSFCFGPVKKREPRRRVNDNGPPPPLHLRPPAPPPPPPAWARPHCFWRRYSWRIR